MKIAFRPGTESGWASVALMVAMPVLLYVGASFRDSLYDSVSAGSTLLEDVATRPALAVTMLMGFASGVAAFFVGIFSIVKKKERSLLVYAATMMGGLLMIFLAAEILFPR